MISCKKHNTGNCSFHIYILHEQEENSKPHSYYFRDATYKTQTRSFFEKISYFTFLSAKNKIDKFSELNINVTFLLVPKMKNVSSK